MARTHLGVRCGLSHTSLLRFETGTQFPKSEPLAAIQQALEEAGVVFIPENGGRPGVRLRKTP